MAEENSREVERVRKASQLQVRDGGTLRWLLVRLGRLAEDVTCDTKGWTIEASKVGRQWLLYADGCGTRFGICEHVANLPVDCCWLVAAVQAAVETISRSPLLAVP
jgi:hypothetical protein